MKSYRGSLNKQRKKNMVSHLKEKANYVVGNHVYSRVPQKSIDLPISYIYIYICNVSPSHTPHTPNGYTS